MQINIPLNPMPILLIVAPIYVAKPVNKNDIATIKIFAFVPILFDISTVSLYASFAAVKALIANPFSMLFSKFLVFSSPHYILLFKD